MYYCDIGIVWLYYCDVGIVWLLQSYAIQLRSLYGNYFVYMLVT